MQTTPTIDNVKEKKKFTFLPSTSSKSKLKDEETFLHTHQRETAHIPCYLHFEIKKKKN